MILRKLYAYYPNWKKRFNFNQRGKDPCTNVQNFWFVGAKGFEPPTSSSLTTHANLSALNPEKLLSIKNKQL